jgi:glycosyltransferase involved in cell wall biosynthesis
MPRYLIDVTRLLYRRMTGRLPTGIDRVSLEYIRHFGAAAPARLLAARALLSWRGLSATLSAADSARLFELLLRPGDDAASRWALTVKGCVFGCIPTGVAGSFLFNTGHYGLEHRFYAALPRRLGARPIVVVHDLIPITHPQYCRGGERERHVRRMRNALRMARGIVANSRHTLEELRRFAAEARLALPKAIVAPLAPALPGTAPGPRPLEAPYFVILGTIEPRKNHLLLARVWQSLVERLGRAAPKLVVIGSRGWHYDEILQRLHGAPLQGSVLERGALTDHEVLTYLRHAQALLMPSHTEGYGLPVAEALGAGVPVIASELAVFRDIAGDIPDYASPTDEARWTALIEDYARPSSAARKAQLERLRAFRPTTWPQHFAAVDDFLESLACSAISSSCRGSRARSSRGSATGSSRATSA